MKKERIFRANCSEWNGEVSAWEGEPPENYEDDETIEIMEEIEKRNKEEEEWDGNSN